jgi:hypothetical protein
MFKKLFSASSSVTEYFLVAAFTFATSDDLAAFIAAMTAAIVAAEPQRENMLAILEEMSTSMASMALLTGDEAKQVELLIRSLRSRPWSFKDIQAARRKLGEHNQAYLKALCNWYGAADSQVFVKTHPEIEPIREMVREWINQAHRIERWW